MKNFTKYCIMVVIMIITLSLRMSAQKITYQKSSFVTNENAEKEMKGERKRESFRRNKAEKRSERAEKRIITKPRYKSLSKGGKSKHKKESRPSDKPSKSKELKSEQE